MEPTIVVALIGAGATIVAALIGRSGGKKAGREEGRKQKEREIDDAPRKYVDHLDRLIRTAVREGNAKAVLNARAIVSTRNDFKRSLVRIADQLNSDIDRLAEEIGEPIDAGRPRNPATVPRPETVYDTLQVLEKRWPAKKDQVEIELRKLLAELGLLGRSPAQASSADSTRERGEDTPPPPVATP